MQADRRAEQQRLEQAHAGRLAALEAQQQHLNFFDSVLTIMQMDPQYVRFNSGMLAPLQETVVGSSSGMPRLESHMSDLAEALRLQLSSMTEAAHASRKPWESFNLAWSIWVKSEGEALLKECMEQTGICREALAGFMHTAMEMSEGTVLPNALQSAAEDDAVVAFPPL